ncbi:MAG: hypothetical protein ABIR91_04485 [Candidatus Saccharimonadales bacterium]
MTEALPPNLQQVSLESLFSQLHSFACDSDGLFRTGQSIGTETTWRSITSATFNDEEYLSAGADDESDTPQSPLEPLHNERAISFEAHRADHLDGAPITFTIGYEVLTQLGVLPPQLLNSLSSKKRQKYASIEPGVLHTLQSVEYTVEKSNNDIVITRDLSYVLQNHKLKILSYIQEQPMIDDQMDVQDDPDPESDIPHLNNDKRHPDEFEQFSYDEKFMQIFDEQNVSFFEEMQLFRDKEAIQCILALVKQLRSRRNIPDVLERPTEVYPREKSYHRN